MTVRELAEWTAEAKIGSLLPEGYRENDHGYRVLRDLAAAKIIQEPAAGSFMGRELFERASREAAQWLVEHPK